MAATRANTSRLQHTGVGAWQRILRELQARTAPSKPRAIKVGATLQEIATQLRLRQTPRFFGLIPEQAALLARFFPDVYEKTMMQAERIMVHHFEIPGMGEVRMGKEIEWHTDHRNHYTWPVEHLNRLKPTVSSEGDPRNPWELSRFYHAVRLGQAYLYTQDERYAGEIVAEITHWIKTNPYGFGINWADTRTAAIRVVNWIWAYYCILESNSLNDGFLALWLASLREHGEYLLKSLEQRKPFTSRLIASLTGLAYLGIVFPEFPESTKWRSVGLRRLWEQLEEQVLPDGLYYDVSSGEQRFVTEAALSVAGLCIVNGIEVPETAQARMRAMLDVIMTYTQLDGLAPMFGDSMDDRLHDLTVHDDPIHQIWDHRHLLALGSLVLERQLSEWAGFIEPSARGWSIAAGDEWQDAFWCFASDAAARFTDVITRVTNRPEEVQDDGWVDVKPGVRLRARALSRKPISARDIAGSRGFEAGGLYVMRHHDFSLSMDAGDRTRGTYRHQDTFSFTLSAYGQTFLIDPGTYTHDLESDDAAELRGMGAHNVLDLAPVNGNGHKEPSLPKNGGHVTVHRWISQNRYDFIDASHDWYGGLSQRLIYRRQLWFDKTSHLWVLHDQVRAADTRSLAGSGELDVRLNFHFGDFALSIDKPNDAIHTHDPYGANLIILPLGDFKLTPAIKTGLYSPRYGIKSSMPVAQFAGRVSLPIDLIVMLYPNRGEIDFKVVRAAGRSALMNFKKALTSLSGTETQRPSDQLIAEKE